MIPLEGIGSVAQGVGSLVGAFKPGHNKHDSNVGRNVQSNKDIYSLLLRYAMARDEPDMYQAMMGSLLGPGKGQSAEYYDRMGSGFGMAPRISEGKIVAPGSGSYSDLGGLLEQNPWVKNGKELAAIKLYQDTAERGKQAKMNSLAGGRWGYSGGMGSYNAGYGGPLAG